MPLTKDSDKQKKFEYELNEHPKCPFCDKEIKTWKFNLERLYKKDIHWIDCPFCSKKLQVISVAIFRFSTHSQPEFQ